MKSLLSRFTGNLRGDLFGGITAGIVALPLALAFGVSSGMENGAAAGLYGAIAVGLFASLFGGTPSQISGPTGPMTVVVAGSIVAMRENPDWVFATVLFAGVFLVLLGVLRLGRLVHYVPYPVVSGFMSGIGVIIILLQIAQLTGNAPESSTLEAIVDIPEDVSSANPAALALGLSTIALVYLVPRLTRAVPSTLVALIVMSLVSWLVAADVPRIGYIPRGPPELVVPGFSVEMLKATLQPALVLAVVCAIDSLLTSLVADTVTKSKHDSERELVGQGIGNVAAGLLGGLPGAGATMRTVVNVHAGGRTHLSGVVHAMLLLAILLALGPLAEQIPMSVLAGILITVGIGIVDARGLRDLLRVPRSDTAVMVTVLTMTVFVDLMWAVGAGVLLAALILLKRISDLEHAVHRPLPERLAEDGHEVPEHLHDVHVVELQGSLFFGNTKQLREKLEAAAHAEAVLLVMDDVPHVDQSGAYAISNFLADMHQLGKPVFLVGLQGQPEELFEKLAVARGDLPEERMLPDFARGLEAVLSHRAGAPGR